MNFQFRNTTSERAIVSQLSRDGKDFTLAIDTALVEHSGVGSDIRTLNEALTGTAETLARVAPDRSPSGFDKEAGALVARTVKPAFGLAVEGQRRSLAEVEKRAADLFSPRFAEGSEPAVRANQHAWWRGLTMPAKLEAASADQSLAAAIVEGGSAMSGLPVDVFDRLRRDMAVGQLAERLMRDSQYRTVADANDPIGGKPDFAAARGAAAAHIDAIEGQRELLSRSVPALLANVITAVALMTGDTRQAAFERLTA